MCPRKKGREKEKKRKKVGGGWVGGKENVDQAILIAMSAFKDAVAAVVLFGGLWSCCSRLMRHKVIVPRL